MKFSFFRVFLVFLCAVGLFTETGFCDCVVINLDDNGGRDGTGRIYAYEGEAYYTCPDSDSDPTIVFDSEYGTGVNVPKKAGCVFEGYFFDFELPDGTLLSTMMIKPDGRDGNAGIAIEHDDVDDNETWVARWQCCDFDSSFLYNNACLPCPDGFSVNTVTNIHAPGYGAHCEKSIENSSGAIYATFNGDDWSYNISYMMCDAGYRVVGSGKDARCDLCPDGEISAGGSAVCTPCESGKEPNDDHTECIECKGPSKYVGADGKCEKCPENQYYVNGQCTDCGEKLCMSGGYCTVCPAGKYCGRDTTLTCDAAPYCGANEYSETGAASCSKCATGYSTTYSGPATENSDFDGLCKDRVNGYGVGCFSADACREIPSQLCFDNSKCGANGTCENFDIDDIDNSKPYVDQYRENCEVSFPFSDNIKINSKNESVIKKL